MNKKNKLICTVLFSSLISVSMLPVGLAKEKQSSSNTEEHKKIKSSKNHNAPFLVTVHHDRALLYHDDSLVISEPIKNGTVYQVIGNKNVEGKIYYKVSQQGQEKGYINQEDVTKLGVLKSNKQTYTTSQGKRVWADLFFSKQIDTTNGTAVYESNEIYTLGNGMQYSKVTYKDDNKKQKIGYIATEALETTSPKNDVKRIVIEKEGNRYSNLEHYEKMGTAYEGEAYQVKYRYRWQGQTYYSIYRLNSKAHEEWAGYINESFVRPVSSDSVQSQYYDYKPVEDTKGYITSEEKLTYYEHPWKNSKATKHRISEGTQIIYDAEAYNSFGNYVQVSTFEKGKKHVLGWLDRRNVSLLHPIRKVANQNQKDMPVWDRPWDDNANQIATLGDFQYGNIEVDQYFRTATGDEYLHIVVDGGIAGWIESDFVDRNKIDVANKVSLVKSYQGQAKWNPIDAVNYATSENGTYLNPVKDVKASIKSIDTSKPGVYSVTYHTKTASKTIQVTVRDKENEGVIRATSTKEATPGYPTIPFVDKDTVLNYTLDQYKKGKVQYGKSPKYGGASWENKKNRWEATESSNQDYIFETEFFMPIRLSQETDRHRLANMSLYQPQSLTVMNNKVFVLYKKLPDKYHPEGRGFIISYDKNNIGELGDLRKLYYYSQHDYKKYLDIIKNIHVGPEIVVGHGQTLTNDGKNLYMNITRERENSKDMTGVNAVNTIDPNTLAITEYNTMRSIAIYPSTKRNRRFFNMTAKDSNTFYGLCKTGDFNKIPKNRGNFELWEIKRQTDGSWTSRQVMILRMAIGNEMPIQGMTYVPVNNSVYIVTDGGFVGLTLPDKQGKVKMIANVKLDAQQRESEGISFSNNRLYIGTNRGGEVLSSSLLQ